MTYISLLQFIKHTTILHILKKDSHWFQAVANKKDNIWMSEPSIYIIIMVQVSNYIIVSIDIILHLPPQRSHLLTHHHIGLFSGECILSFLYAEYTRVLCRNYNKYTVTPSTKLFIATSKLAPVNSHEPTLS